jgi:hypothetical protein
VLTQVYLLDNDIFMSHLWRGDLFTALGLLR